MSLRTVQIIFSIYCHSLQINQTRFIAFAERDKKSFSASQSRRKRGMVSNPLFIIPDFFFCIFPMNFAMVTLGLKEMGKFLWEGREKNLPSWLSQFNFAKLRQPTGQTFSPTFPKEFSHFLQT